MTRMVSFFAALSACVVQATHAQCNPPLWTGQPTAFGYAMARAFGCGFYEAANYYADRVSSQYFSTHTSSSYQVGDIIIFGPMNVSIGNINMSNGHATYVAEIRSSGSGGDGPATPIAAAPGEGGGDENIIVHEISSWGDTYPDVYTLAQVKSMRIGDVVKGFHRRLKHPDMVAISRSNYSFNGSNWSVTITGTPYSYSTGSYQIMEPGDNWVWKWYENGILIATTPAYTNWIQLTREIGTTSTIYVQVVVLDQWTKSSSSLTVGQNTHVTLVPYSCSAASSEWSVVFEIRLAVDGATVPVSGSYGYIAEHTEYWNCASPQTKPPYGHLETDPPNVYRMDGNLNKPGVPVMTRLVHGKIVLPSGRTLSSSGYTLPDAFGCVRTCSSLSQERQAGNISEVTPGPAGFSLMQNYPNPFNPETNVRFEIPEESDVMITIFDILGREVRTLVTQQLSAGSFSVPWDGTDNNGSKVAAGTYVCRMVATSKSGKDYIESVRMILAQ